MTIYITPDLIKRMDAKVERLMTDWNIHRNELHTLWQMVATIEAGQETRLFYDGNGLVYDGWNGYKGMENDDLDPNSAWGGFYRGDNTMVGWAIYLIAGADNKQDQCKICWRAYHKSFVWEEKEMVWGFYSYKDFYTQADQAEEAVRFENQPHVKRVARQGESESSGMYRLIVETTRKKSGLKNEWKQRVAV